MSEITCHLKVFSLGTVNFGFKRRNKERNLSSLTTVCQNSIRYTVHCSCIIVRVFCSGWLAGHFFYHFGKSQLLCFRQTIDWLSLRQLANFLFLHFCVGFLDFLCLSKLGWMVRFKMMPRDILLNKIFLAPSALHRSSRDFAAQFGVLYCIVYCRLLCNYNLLYEGQRTSTQMMYQRCASSLPAVQNS